MDVLFGATQDYNMHCAKLVGLNREGRNTIIFSILKLFMIEIKKKKCTYFIARSITLFRTNLGLKIFTIQKRIKLIVKNIMVE